MALTGARILTTTRTHSSHLSPPHPTVVLVTPSWWSPLPLTSRRANSHIVSAAKKLSRTGKFDSKNKRGGSSTSTTQQDESEIPTGEIGAAGDEVTYDDGFVLPDLPGDKPDFWEGPQWDGFGFFIQYLWAFGIVFALISSGIAVATYNEGATDFKETPAYKESIQSRELLEQPEDSNADVFETNPTEEAPSLE